MVQVSVAAGVANFEAGDDCVQRTGGKGPPRMGGRHSLYLE